MFDKIKNLFKKPEPVKPVQAKKPRQPKKKKEDSVLSDKEKATAAGEPFVAITKINVNPNSIGEGEMVLDFNDKFVLNLIKSGYKQRDDDTDDVIVDRWFQTVCRNIALELYEQQAADPEHRAMTGDVRVVRSKDLGNGRTEVS
jgi:hypothetical protein